MSDTLNIRVPGQLVDALARAAPRQMQTRSEYVRQAVLDRLRREGIDPAKEQHGDGVAA